MSRRVVIEAVTGLIVTAAGVLALLMEAGVA